MRKARGLSTLELIIAVAVVLVLMAVTIPFYNRMQVQARYNKLVATMAEDFNTLSKVAIRYLRDHRIDILANAPNYTVVETPDLIAQNYLPVNWGQYDGVAGQSPVRSEYHIMYQVDAADPSIIRTIVSEHNDWDWAVTQKHGVTITGDHLAGGTLKIAGDVGDYAVQRYGLTMGVQQPNTQTAVIRGNNAEISVAELHIALPRAKPIAFIGWPELGQDQPETGGKDGYKEIRVITRNDTSAFDPVALTRQCSDLGPGWVEIYKFSPCEAEILSGDTRRVIEQEPDFYRGRLGIAVGIAELGTYLNLSRSVQETVLDSCQCPVNDPTRCRPIIDPCQANLGQYKRQVVTAHASLGGTGAIAQEMCKSSSWYWRNRSGIFYWEEGVSGIGWDPNIKKDYYYDIKAICGLQY